MTGSHLYNPITVHAFIDRMVLAFTLSIYAGVACIEKRRYRHQDRCYSKCPDHIRLLLPERTVVALCKTILLDKEIIFNITIKFIIKISLILLRKQITNASGKYRRAFDAYCILVQ